MTVPQKRLLYYRTQNGKAPFEEWLDDLRDQKARAKIRVRLDRLENSGHTGDCETVGGGVYELKIHLGPGYRVYFGRDGETLMVLLLGGDKGAQERDIKKAITYWEDYKIRK